MVEKPVMLVALDDGESSFYALEWTLDHFFAPNESHPFKLMVIHARASPASLIGMGGIASGEFITILGTDLKRKATTTIEKAKDICSSKSVSDVSVQIIEGDPRNVLCDAVERHQASMLVLGSHGYGIVKRAVVGSVSNFCAHHAHCSVMIVKRPKLKH